jgi:hypothetical protein
VKRGRSTGTPTAAQVARFEAIHRLGCIASRIRGVVLPATIHHLTIGGKHGQKRRGHDFTIGLSEWHHLGVPVFGLTHRECEARFGPSYARTPRAFREVFGQDDVLLAYQNDLIARLGAEAA